MGKDRKDRWSETELILLEKLVYTMPIVMITEAINNLNRRHKTGIVRTYLAVETRIYRSVPFTTQSMPNHKSFDKPQKIKRLDTNFVYSSLKEASKDLKMSTQVIKRECERNGWLRFV